jgi:class 3 adenylate cyclase/predicted ATPase
MRCGSCNNDNPEGARFCNSCGAALQLRCPQCEALNRPGSKYCNQCGFALALIAAQPEPAGPNIGLSQPVASDFVPTGERKLVTALFVDIINSTGLQQDLDPEEARAIVDPALQLMIDAVRRYGGHVVQSTGDGIFALFGAPIAHEDHPQRSLYAALRLQDEIRRYSEGLRAEGKQPIQIRAGANTGEVVVRPIKTGDEQTEYTPIGHTVNLASRVQSLAKASSIVISDATRSLVEGYFALSPLGSAHVRGINEPINIYEVTGLGPLRTRLERSAGRGLTRFVGRGQEKDTFRRAADLARSGSGQILALMAEPGVGKSRLFFEFKTEASGSFTVCEAFAVSHGKGAAYLPIVELLRGYFAVNANDDAVAREGKIRSKTQDLAADLTDAVPYLNALLEAGDDRQRLAAMDAGLRRTRTLDAILRLFLSEGERRPLLLIIEDLHWLDDESQAVLDLLAGAIASAKILLLVNYRPEYELRWGGMFHCRQLRLESLDRGHATDLLTAILGEDARLAQLKELIIETTGGTPFFMEETVQSLFDEGALERRDSGVELVRALSSLRIPPTVQTILAARIDRLQNDEKTLLQTLAVLGREFVLSLARAVAGKSEDELERLISKLQLGEFVYEQPSVNDVEYIFKHALTQEVAYNSVLVERRRSLHEHVGQAIETLYGPSLDDYVGDLAHHFSRSGNRAKAVEYLRRAGMQAMSRGAIRQAVEDFETALGLLKSLPPDLAGRDGVELQLLNPLGTAYIAVRGYAAPEVGPIFSRAREICGVIGEPQQQFAMLFGNFAWRVVRGEMDRSLALAEEALLFAEKADDRGMWIEALFLKGVTLFYRGDFAGARALYERALANYDDRDLTRSWALRVGEDAGVTHRCYLALTLWHLGFADQARRLNRETRELARSIRHPFSLAYAQHHTSWLYQLMKLPNETLLFSDEQIHTSAEQGFPLFQATGTIYNAAAQLLQGRARRVVPVLRNGLDAYRATGAGLSLPYYLCLLAEAYARAGLTDEAASAIADALQHVETSGERSQEAELHRLRGELALGDGQTAEAEEEFQTAIGIATSQGSKAWELRSAASLARLYQRLGRREEARAPLETAYGAFTEGFDTPDLQDAKTLLATL